MASDRVLSRVDVPLLKITRYLLCFDNGPEAAAKAAFFVRFGFDPDIVCPGGGAIALGHPWGASGALLLVRLATQMASTTSPALGLAACAIGGGQGIAMLVERVDR